MRKLKFIHLFALALIAVALLTSVSPVWAQDLRPPPIPGLPGVANETPQSLIRDIIIRVLLPIAGIIAVLFIIIGGFQYITSGANQELAETGKKTLRNAIIGLIVIILSYVMVSVIFNTLLNVT